ncbi:24-dehydrocholesterol reductase-like protein precursor [Sporormia fimetaria CBS 119925]|uniref:Delta(24)-sterol reductase n=1 Tax=Sporormia fimetaria CBS 119925 TaxID=1340428 RepID=A0A6A6VRE1_9PLEO|nr:24-dehydrocholesterol reductase-like protein precursor [Sporormia fimetaria CBS 119925]
MEDPQHKATVEKISEKVRHFYQTETPFRIYHGSTLSTRASTRRKDRVVDVSSLNHVLDFDKARKRVLVEPNVPMDALVAATTAQGLLPQVVMELPNITVGGGFAGTSGESSSFRYGIFDRTIKAIEIVLGNGDVVWASGDDPETRDLFYGCAGSCGSLGIITLLEMQLIDAKQYVELTYHPTSSVQESLQLLQTAEKDPSVDYIDGIQFSFTGGVIMTGRLTDTPIPGRKPQTFDKASDPWFYMHAEAIMKSTREGKALYKDTIPVTSYLFRYDRAVFWSGLRAFKYFVTPLNALTRYLLDPFMRTRTMIHALHRSGLSSQTIIQDLAIPYNSAEEFIRFTHKQTGLWPLWLCPIKMALGTEKSFSAGKNIDQETLLDIGIWGMGPRDEHQFIRLNREFEAEVERLGGLKCLYACAYYTEDEFWRIYDENKYLELRKKWHAERLPSVYEKIRVDLRGVVPGQGAKAKEGWAEWMRRQFWGIWPLGGLYGIASATKGLIMGGGDFLLKK